VFKVVYAIHDLFPTMSYRTIVGAGNPQLVVIRRSRPNFSTYLDDLEAISRLSHSDFLESHSVVLGAGSEGEVIAWVAASMASGESAGDLRRLVRAFPPNELLRRLGRRRKG
jgi:hypothetical protein